MQRMRELLVLALLGFLPFHAFFVTVGTKLIAGPGHAPMAMLAVWKEAMLAGILLIAVCEMVRSLRRIRLDLLDLAVIGLFCLAALAASRSSFPALLLGFKYDLLPLVAFLMLRRVPWSGAFTTGLTRVLLVVGTIVAAYGIVTYFLPMSFFTALGYSAGHSLYMPDGPLAAFQQIGGSAIRRMQGPMSGPNQLGLWLLIPWSIGIVHGLRQTVGRPWPVVGTMIVGAAIFLTFSRAAWVGAALILIGAVTLSLPRARTLRMIGGFCGVACIGILMLSVFLPSVLLRAQSNRGHWQRPLEALRIMRDQPLGRGLGAAGPASNRLKEPCVFLEPGADAAWAKESPALCVFVGNTQVQPAGRTCDCPLLPENWYLQIGVELGILGMLLFIALTIVVLKYVSEQPATFLIFLAVSVAALFLHAWEDPAVAYTTWIFLAGALPSTGRRAVVD